MNRVRFPHNRNNNVVVPDNIRPNNTTNAVYNTLPPLRRWNNHRWSDVPSNMQTPRGNFIKQPNITTQRNRTAKKRFSCRIGYFICGACVLLLISSLIAVITIFTKFSTTTRSTMTQTTVTTTTATTTTSTSTTSSTSSTSTSTTSTTSATTQTTSTTSSTSSTSVTSTTTTTALTCSLAGHGTLATFSGTPLTWMKYQYNHTASTTALTLLFGFTGDGSSQRVWILDDVSIVDTAAPGIELLQNPSFDNSTTALTDWTQWCTSTCPGGSTNAGQVTSGPNCTSTNCYIDHCYGGGANDFLSQTVATTSAHVYTISFWILDYGSGPNGATKAYVDVY